MDDGINFYEDFGILQDMFPEITVTSGDIIEGSAEEITGQLPFKVNLLDTLKVEFEDKSCALDGLGNDTLHFTIDPQQYPNLRESIILDVNSYWMNEDDKMTLLDAVDKEFGDMTDPKSESFVPNTPVLMLVFSYIHDDSSSILFPGSVKACKSINEYNKFLSIKMNLEKEQLNNTNFDCCICMETKKGRSMVKLPCQTADSNHYLCRECVVSYFSTLIKEGRTEQIRCPECEYKPINLEKFTDYKKMKNALFTPLIPFSFFEDFLDDELCKRYINMFRSHASTKLSKYCPFACKICPRCDTWCIKDDLDDSLLQCSKCNFAFCFVCSHSWHGYNNPCGKSDRIPNSIIEEYLNIEGETTEVRKKELEAKFGKKRLQQEGEEYISDRMLDLAIEEEGSNLQRCPNCRLVIERSEGCNKMRCSVCHTLFCFICATLLNPEDPYEHFREIISPCYGRLFDGMPGLAE
ncbi:Translation termination inhibitor protein ITT1 [Nakaseomyces bracarensis]|uniref:RBR-type E3 ubiquitin transferase n=1 Tax=Nakaseomyces bracarensis TaxID=273131 RepID=A0ABR4NXD9_9SACH